MNRPLTQHEKDRLDVLHSDRIDQFLRSGHGECFLKDDSVASIIADAFRFFDNQRYRLYAWCIMPNHVHVVVQPFPDHALSAILQSWKSYTSKAANKFLNRTGTFWQPEYYDRFIRDEDHLFRAMDYVWRNSELAGMNDWKWRWKMEQKDLEKILHGQDAHATI